MYKYDMMSAYAAGGRAATKHLEDVRGDQNAKDASSSKALKNNKVISKDLSWRPEPISSDHPLAPINEEYCSKCRRLFEGQGDHAINLLKTDNTGMFFQHWDGYFLEKSASRGCPLCNIIWRSHQRVRSDLARGEEIPMRYDYGSFVSTDARAKREIFAVRFYPFTLLEERGQMMPYQLPLVTVHLEPASGLRPSLRSSSGSADTDSVESMKQLRDWLEQCENEHPVCGLRQLLHSSFFPDRLISVGDSESSRIRIISGKDVPHESKYVTLSHCWGSPPKAGRPFILLETNISNFMEDIPLQELPNTFAHACAVARAIGVQYIWIDSLCIIQDSKEDWRRHAAMMWEVYSNSHLNLSATASYNSSQGLFRKRHPATLSQCVVTISEGHAQIHPGEYICYSDDEWLDLVDYAPVNTRAWVCQERLLSPRIVHFSMNQLFWECHELKASERFPGGIPSRYDSSKHRLLHNELPKKDPRKLLEIWHSIVAEYTSANLTYGSDKLVAVSALAKQVAESSQVAGEYLAGLWKDQLLGQLCWSSSARTTRPKGYRAPSWSWACLDGAIWPRFDWSGYGHDGFRYASKPLVKIIDASVASERDPFVSVSAGEIHISGPLYRVALAQPKKPRSRPSARSADQRKADIVKIMSQVKPGFTSENMVSIGMSDGPMPTGSQLLHIDPTAGILAMDDSASNQLEKIEDESIKRDFEMDLGQHKGDMHLDEDITLDEMSQMDIIFLPVLCYSNLDRVYNTEGLEIESITGLVLTKAEGGRKGVYRRIGVGKLDDHGAAEFFCNLGNQELDSSLSLKKELMSEGRLRLEDFVPGAWPGKELEFVPKDFACYPISII